MAAILPYFGFKLPGILISWIILRMINNFLLLWCGSKIFPQIKKLCFDFSLLTKLLRFGSWIMVSNIVGPILVYLEKILIATFISTTALAYYNAPAQIIQRLAIIPSSLTPVLFSAFSRFENQKERIRRYFVISLKFLFFIIFPLMIILILFSKDILNIWLGEDFAKNSKWVLQILSVAMFINFLAHIPYTLLQSKSPNLPAVFHLCELPFFIILCIFLIPSFKIEGAALAWTARVFVDAILLFLGSFRLWKRF
jgi:O-antigen/teichoic acid export membrane protein